MKPAAEFPFLRVFVALLLSLIVHALLLWKLPEFKFTDHKTPLPVLQAKLEPLHLPAKKLQMPEPGKPYPPKPASPIVKPAHTPATEKIDLTALPAQPTDTSAGMPGASAVQAAPTTAHAEENKRPTLPRRAQLHYAVQYGSGNFKVGEVLHEFENINGHYTLHAETQTTGLLGIFKNYHVLQNSSGTVDKEGLRPDSYTETRKDSSGTQVSTARFDWIGHRIVFANKQESHLPPLSQDFLSLPYQLSQLPLNQASIPIALTNGRNIKQHFLAVGEEVTISTPKGELRTIVLHKVRDYGEDGLIIWLALEYRLLPVKILYLDKSGEISANMVITDIRVSDE